MMAPTPRTHIRQHAAPKVGHRLLLFVCALFLAACDGNDPSPTPPEPLVNAPPSAQAGTDREASRGQVVTLSGAGSSDPEGVALAYVWRQTSGPDVALDHANTERATFIAPRVEADAVLTFELTVTDTGGLTDQDAVSITVPPPPPTHPTNARIVSAPQSGDTYGATETIAVEVDFNHPVQVTDTPTITLTIGTQTRQARYVRGSGTRTLTFEYAVQEDDDDAGGIEIGSLSPTGGTITDDNDEPVEPDFEDEPQVDIQVDGEVDRVATVTEVRIETTPRDAEAYRAEETIAVRVTFSEAVTITDGDAGGGPSLAFTIDTAIPPVMPRVRYGAMGDRWLRFEYVVRDGDVDTDGISIAADALQLGGGGIVDAGSTEADLDLGSHAIINAPNHKVIARGPTGIIGVRITSAPSAGNTYGLGEKILVAVDFSHPVNVVGTGENTPSLTLTVGAQTRTSAYEGGSGSTTLTFGYTVQGGDDDADGIGITALQRGGGIMDAQLGPAELALGPHAIANAPGHRTIGREPARVARVRITSTPRAGNTYGLGEKIVVAVDFSHPVNVVGTPSLTLVVGARTRTAAYEGGSGTATLGFGYIVQGGDEDEDGIGIAALQRGGGIMDAQLGPAGLALGPHAITDVPNHAAAGREPAHVIGVHITSTPRNGNTYGLGENIVVAVDFSHPVSVTGTPSLALMVGVQARTAAYQGGDETATLTFAYTVQSGDEDADGIGIAADALQVDGGELTDLQLGTADLGLAAHAVNNAPGHAVVGREPAHVTGVRITSTPRSGNAYGLGEKIVVAVEFSHPVGVTGTPDLDLMVGAVTQPAVYEGGDGTATLTFAYTVQSGDEDADGIGLIAAAQLHGGSITDPQLGPVDLALGTHAVNDTPGHGVAGREPASIGDVRITSTPRAGGIYGLGERIEVAVTFFYPVGVTGTPSLGLNVGGQIAAAAFERGSGTDTLHFAYTVQGGDNDDDGISITALQLNGGGIDDLRLGPADLVFDGHVITDAPNHAVIGRKPAHVSGVRITSKPRARNTYSLGERVEVAVDFSQVVDVALSPIPNPALSPIPNPDPAPTLDLNIGAQTRTAAYEGGGGTATLRFAYTVQGGDDDEDGIGVTALQLNGSGIEDPQLGPADSALGIYAIDNAPNHAVAGRERARVTGVRITSTPQAGSAYGLGEKIVVVVTFSHAVIVYSTPTPIPTPTFALGIGGQTRRAAYEGGSGTTTLTFGYVVRDGDRDDGGIRIAPNALQLTGGGINDPRFGPISPAFLSDVIADMLKPMVAGREPASVTGVRIDSTPRAGSAYGLGEKIVVAITFSHPVDVAPSPTPNPDPVPFLTLTVGAQARTAAFEGGLLTSTLRFAYTVQSGDDDADGISIAADALRHGNGSINDLQLGAASLDLGSHAIVNAANHAVVGREPARVSGVRITSTPRAMGVYGLGEKIVVTVTFSHAVDVTGSPIFVLAVGTHIRLAAYEGGGGTALTFGYTVQNIDDDADGIGYGPDALRLNGGGINDPLLGAADLASGAYAVTQAPGHAVLGREPASVTGVRVTSTPRAGGIYTLGEKIVATVTFSHPVEVIGVPTIPFLIGGHVRSLAYESGTGTASLTFGYTVQGTDGEGTGGRISIAPNTLQLSGGGINDLRLGPADITFQGDDIAEPSHVVIGREPIGVSGVGITSLPTAGASAYGLGAKIVVVVHFQQAVDVEGAPSLTLNVGAQVRSAAYEAGSGSTTLSFGYTVQSGDVDDDGIGIAADALRLNGGAINDTGGLYVNLDLGSLARVNVGHAVAGRDRASVSGVRIASTPRAMGVYGLGEKIVAEVDFSHPVNVTGTPTLTLNIGTQARAAAFEAGSGSATLRFGYTVQSGDTDDDGISITALNLSGGDINDPQLGPADLDLGTHAIADAANHEVLGRDRAGVTGVRVTSTPRTGGIYTPGEKIVVTVTFSRPVDVTGVPTIAFLIGGHARSLAYESGTGTTSLTFGYTVQDTDGEGTGGRISIAPNTLQLSGGSINDRQLGPADITFQGDDIAEPSHVVIGREPMGVSGVRITSMPPTGSSAYGLNQEIVVAVDFPQIVNVTGTPSLALNVGTQTRAAAYESGSGSTTLTFEYAVQSGDVDDDGISIAADALERSGGGIDDTGGLYVDLDLGSHAIANAAGHAVAGREPASVSGVRITSTPRAMGIYGLGENIVAEVDFSHLVNVTGTPTLTLNIGTQTRAAAFEAGSGTTTLRFGYTVQGDDTDDDGISITSLGLNGGGINDPQLGPADLDLGTHAIADASNHEVTGRDRASVTGVRVTSTPRTGGIYTPGEKIVVTVTFSHPVEVTGTPTIPFLIGGHARSVAYESGTGTTSLTFGYTVQDTDGEGTDGRISIAPNTLQLSGGSINDLRLGPADIAFQDDDIAEPSHVVIGRDPIGVSGVRITSAPPTGSSAYGLNQEIVVAVDFPQIVNVTGTPSLTLNVGTQTRVATYESGSGSTTLTFEYTVQNGDDDADGISIAADALQLNGGAINDTGGLYADLDLGSHVIANAAGHAVAGRQPAHVSGVRITSTPNALNTYGIGEKITVAVDFSHAVDVTGSPIVNLGLRGNLSTFTRTKPAAYEGGGGSATLNFGYTVQSGDSDNNGISIAADALQLNGGSITDPQLGSASLDLGSHAITNASDHQVVGREPAHVRAIIASSTPRHGDTYSQGEMIVVYISFSTTITVTGSPTLALMIGTQTRSASLHQTTSNLLYFTYTVQSGDTDDDGISIASDGVQLGDATILDAQLGEPVNLDLSTALMIGLSSRKVAGRERASISGVRITSTPSTASTYTAGDQITVAIDFSYAVNASGLALAPPLMPISPSLLLDIGGQPRLADYVRGDGTATFHFAYTVQNEDDDDDGISIPGNALHLGGQTIDDPALGPIDPLLGTHAIVNTSGHKVMGREPTRVSGVRITSAPWRANTYGRRAQIEVAVSFSRAVTIVVPVSIADLPALTLVIGTQNRSAAYTGGSGTNTLTFAYTVQNADADDDGISITTLAPGDGINDAAPSPANLDLGAHAITNDADHKVDGSLSSTVGVVDVRITSTPLAQDTYGATEAITVEVVFSGDITLGSTSTDFPVLNLAIESQTRQAAFQGRRDTPPRLVFQHTVQDTDVDTDGISIAADALDLGSGGTLTDSASDDIVPSSLAGYAITNDADHKVDGSVDRVATVTGVTIFSSPDMGDTYGSDERIMVRVTFSEIVTAAGSPDNGPRLVLTIGANARSAPLRSTGSLQQLEFDYFVESTESDPDGLSIAADALQLGSDGSITDAGGQAANLDIGSFAIADDADHKVDGSLSTPPTANAGADVQAATATVVTLDGSGSRDGQTSTDDLTYAWSQVCGPTVALTNATSMRATFTAQTHNAGGTASGLGLIPGLPTGVMPFAAYTTHTFELTVTDEQGNTDTDTVTVTAIPNFTPEPFPASNNLQNKCVSPRSGSDENGSPYGESQGTALDERKWLRSWVHERYLWHDEVVDQDPADHDNMRTYFALRKTFAEATSCGKPKDEFHFFSPSATAAPSASAPTGATDTGLGVELSRSPTRIFVGFVHAGSPAATAALTTDSGSPVATGLRRGDRITAVNGTPVNAATLSTAVSILKQSGIGVTIEVEISRSGTFGLPTASITTGIFEIDPVPLRSVIDTGTGKVGYLLFMDHSREAEEELIEAIEFFNEQDITDLVLDLRYNGGGLLNISNSLATMIANPSATSGRVFERYIHSNKRSGANFYRSFNPNRVYSMPGTPLPNLGLNRLFVLTSGLTCSASESIINGLRGVDIEVIQVGTTTCGKPYGTYPTDHCGTTYHITQFIGFNAKDFGDHQHGFAPMGRSDLHENTVLLPGCWVLQGSSNLRRTLGNADEQLFAAALAYRSTDGSCTAMSPSGTTRRSRSQNPAEAREVFKIVPRRPPPGGGKIVEEP